MDYATLLQRIGNHEVAATHGNTARRLASLLDCGW
jgi:hypothetical protein